MCARQKVANWGKGRMKQRLAVGKLHCWRKSLATFAMLCAAAAGARAQGTSSATGGQSSTPPETSTKTNDTLSTTAAKPTTDSQPEVSSKDTGTTFKLRVNLVQVRVVVRNSKGNLVEGLKREDFQLFDQGKLQAITTFGVETPKSRRELAEAAAKTQQGATEETEPQDKVALPERFIALVFDDIHLKVEDAVFVRASSKALIDSLAPTDRLAILTTSGTDDIRSGHHIMAERKVKGFGLLMFGLFHFSFFIQLIEKPSFHQHGMGGHRISKFIVPVECF
jgi:hypothetical protein